MCTLWQQCSHSTLSAFASTMQLSYLHRPPSTKMLWCKVSTIDRVQSQTAGHRSFFATYLSLSKLYRKVQTCLIKILIMMRKTLTTFNLICPSWSQNFKSYGIVFNPSSSPEDFQMRLIWVHGIVLTGHTLLTLWSWSVVFCQVTETTCKVRKGW